MQKFDENFTVAELRCLCRKFGISGAGLKADIVRRIYEYFAADESNENLGDASDEKHASEICANDEPDSESEIRINEDEHASEDSTINEPVNSQTMRSLWINTVWDGLMSSPFSTMLSIQSVAMPNSFKTWCQFISISLGIFGGLGALFVICSLLLQPKVFFCGDLESITNAFAVSNLCALLKHSMQTSILATSTLKNFGKDFAPVLTVFLFFEYARQ